MAPRSVIDESLAAGGTVDFDAVMRETLHHESAEVLRHQIACERAHSAKLQRPDVFLSVLLAGIGIGFGLKAATPKPSKRSK